MIKLGYSTVRVVRNAIPCTALTWGKNPDTLGAAKASAIMWRQRKFRLWKPNQQNVVRATLVSMEHGSVGRARQNIQCTFNVTKYHQVQTHRILPAIC